MKKSYFTLTELLVTIGIIIFLMGISIGVMNLVMNKSTEAKCKGIIEKVKIAMESYKAKTGYYIQCPQGYYFYVDTQLPNADDFRDFLPMQDSELDAGYLKDAFGKRFFYQCPGVKNRMTFDLYSAGADTKYGSYTDAAATDNITNFSGN